MDRTNSLAARFPRIAAEWHPTKNGGLTPGDVTKRSGRRVWWSCKEGHVWQATVARRTDPVSQPGCPYCDRRAVPPGGSLAARFPAIAREWHPKKNGPEGPKDVLADSHRVVWWKCPEGPDHEWRAPIVGRTVKRTPCPFCAGRKLSVTNSLAAVFPELAAQWHPTKNRGLTARDVTYGSNKSVWWKCRRGPDHEWRTQIHHRVVKDTGCPFCAGKRVSVTNCLATVAPRVANEWHRQKNRPLTPKTVHHGTNRTVWWKCKKGPDHEWRAKVETRTKHDGGCPFCEGKRVSVTNCLAKLFPKIAREWHPKRNGKVSPGGVLAAAKSYAWWRCPVGHEYRMKISERTVRGRACPVCGGG